MEKPFITDINSSIHEVQVALQSGYKDKNDLPVLQNTREILESQPDRKTMLKLINARIKRIEKSI